ncbi:hypothetical protein AAW14_21815 [Streptomyces hygroscopicus]|nr:hypothetical protein [Streptomyces hygroscopicus]
MLAVTVLIVALAGWYGSGVVERLSNGGYAAATGNLRTARSELGQRFGVEQPQLLLLLRADRPLDDPRIAAAGVSYTERVGRQAGVLSAQSYWTTGDGLLRSHDGRSGVVAVRLAGDDDQAQRTAKRIVPGLTGRQGPFDVGATGEAESNAELQHRSDQDLAKAELVAAPIVLLVLLLVFRTVLAALLPFLIGVIGVVLTLAILRVVTEFADVSIFALNLTTALGLGLAVDYSLFLLMRFREETGRGRTQQEALVVAVRTAGHAVFFSAVTVALCLSALVLFPLYFLRSLAYAAIPAVLTVGAAAVLVLPPALLVFGRWLDAGDITPVLRRLGRRSAVPEESWWSRLATRISRRPVLVALPAVLVLILLGLPFTHAKFGLTDERVLPADAEAYRTARMIDSDFDARALDPIQVVVRTDPRANAGRGEEDSYYRSVSRIDGVAHVTTALGTYAKGEQVDRPGAAPGVFARGGVFRLDVVSEDTAFSPRSERIVHRIRAMPAPGAVFVAGDSALFADTKSVIGNRLPYALGVIALVMFVLLLLFTGGLLVPLKAIVFNTLSLTASFGAMVYVFQYGHLKWLVGDFVSTGYLDVTVPVLMFCAAFGLSMDYEIFLMSRIRERYAVHGDNTRAVIEGVGRTGSLITAAAVLIGGVLLALATSQVSVLKLLGLGMFLAVVMDAVVIRGVLVPAFMMVMGRANWWAPARLRRLHAKVGVRAGG